jgi:hypothetical protein
MVRGLPFLLLIILSGELTRAQKLRLTEKLEINVRKDDFAALGKYQEFFVGFHVRNEEAQILLYDSVGKLRKRVPITGYDNSCSEIHFQCNAHHLCIFYEKKDGRKQVLQGVQLLADTSFSDPKELANYERVMFKEHNEFQYAVSEDNTKILFYTYTNGGDDVALHALLLDDALNIQREINQLFEKDKCRFLLEQAISNNGTAHIVVTTDLDERSAADNLQVLSYAPGSNTFSTIEIPLKNKYLGDIHLFMDNPNEVCHIVAYYSESNRSSPRGIYHTEIKLTGSNNLVGYMIPISLGVSKISGELRDLKIRAITSLKNGSLEIAAEKTYKSTRTLSSISPSISGGVGISMMNSSMDNSRTVTEYNYDEVSVFNINHQGKLNWSQNVLKSQVTTDDLGIFSSFGLLESKLGKVYIFNDVNRRSTALIAGYMSSKGAINVKQLPTTEDMESLEFLPRSSIQVSSNEIVMPCISKGSLCFLNIQF